MSHVALISAWGGSEGNPRKIIWPFPGKPYLPWSIYLARSAPSVDQVLVSTDDLEIAEISLAGGAEVPLLRLVELAIDITPRIAQFCMFCSS